MTLRFLNDVVNDAESIQKSKSTSKIETIIPSLPGSALKTHVESLSKPRDVNKRSQSLTW